MIRAFFDDPAGVTLYGVLAVMLADLLLGVAAAFRDDTFSLAHVAAFLRTHAAGRVAPIGALLAIGWFGQQPALTAIGMGAAAAYALETLGSVRDSWARGHGPQQVPGE